DGDDDGALRGEMTAVEKRAVRCASRIGAAVEVDQDRQPRAPIRRWGPDVEDQAVLALRHVRQARLRRGRAVAERVDGFARRQRRRRGLEAGGLTVADAKKAA